MCAPEVSGHTMALEVEYGVPSVAVHADAFARLVESVARVNGMPRARRAFVPTPVLDKTPSELRAYIEGPDPVRGRPFMAEVLEALTRAIDEEDLRGVEFDRSTPRLVDPDTEENLHRLFRENHWTDFFPSSSRPRSGWRRCWPAPATLPTRSSAAAPDRVPGAVGFTVEKVAVNAVMAGADPKHFPTILALAAKRPHSPPEQHLVDGEHGRRERPDPRMRSA